MRAAAVLAGALLAAQLAGGSPGAPGMVPDEPDGGVSGDGTPSLTTRAIPTTTVVDDPTVPDPTATTTATTTTTTTTTVAPTTLPTPPATTVTVVVLSSQLGTGGGQGLTTVAPTTTTTLVVTTFPTILPPFTTAPVPTRPPTTPLTTAPPPTTQPPPTEPPDTEPPATFRPTPTTPRATAPPPTEPPPTEPPPSVSAPPPSIAGATTTTLPVGTGMVSDKVSSEPGGTVTLTGGGCTPNAPVTVAVGDRVIGSIPGTPDGKFIAILNLPQLLEVGRHDIIITCGVVHSLPIDIVVASHLDSGNSVLALFIFFVLMVIALFRRRRLVLAKRAPSDDELLQP